MASCSHVVLHSMKDGFIYFVCVTEWVVESVGREVFICFVVLFIDSILRWPEEGGV